MFLEKLFIVKQVGDWQAEFDWIHMHSRGKTLTAILLHVAWTAYTYHIWQARNIKFGGECFTFEEIVKCIVFDVQNRMQGFVRFDDSPTNTSICINWGIGAGNCNKLLVLYAHFVAGFMLSWIIKCQLSKKKVK